MNERNRPNTSTLLGVAATALVAGPVPADQSDDLRRVSFEDLIHVQTTSVSKREQKLSVNGVINISTKQSHETRRVVVSVPSGTDEHAVTEARDGGAAFKISAKPQSLTRGVQSGPTHPGRAS